MQSTMRNALLRTVNNMYTITNILPQKRCKTRYNIMTEDGFLLSLSDESIVRHSLKIGKSISEELLGDLRREDTLKYAKELSLRYITYAPRSEQQVRNHLAERGIDPESIERACAFLHEYGYLDDARYARQYAESYLKKYSPYLVKQRLLHEGISPAEADAAITELSSDEPLRAMYEKLEKKYSSEEPLKRKKKICDALARRGYRWSEIAFLFHDDEF